MDSITIEKILNLGSRTSKIFKGCFPCDLLPQPEKLDYPAALIINLETHQFEGSHWVAVFAHGLEKEVYYFDSLALPIKKTIADFLGAFPNLIKNSHAYQNLFSHTCAHYCICFIPGAIPHGISTAPCCRHEVSAPLAGAQRGRAKARWRPACCCGDWRRLRGRRKQIAAAAASPWISVCWMAAELAVFRPLKLRNFFSFFFV